MSLLPEHMALPKNKDVFFRLYFAALSKLVDLRKAFNTFVVHASDAPLGRSSLEEVLYAGLWILNHHSLGRSELTLLYNEDVVVM